MEMVVAEEEVVVVTAETVSVDINQALELLVAVKHPKELGRGRPRSDQDPVLHFVVELWLALNGLLQQLIARRVNLPQAFV